MHTDINIINQSNTPNLTSLIVRERLKNCVLNKRKSKEQGIGVVNPLTNHQQESQIQTVKCKNNANSTTTDKDLQFYNNNNDNNNNKISDLNFTENNLDKIEHSNLNDCITPLTIDIEKLSTGSSTNLASQMKSTLSQCNNNNNSIDENNDTSNGISITNSNNNSSQPTQQLFGSFQENETQYMNFQSLQTSIIGSGICGNLVGQNNDSTPPLQQQQQHYPHHLSQHSQQHPLRQQSQQRITSSENLRKTVSEPSLKMRSGSGGVQKYRYKPDRRHFGANSATAAVAAAAMVASNDPLSVVGFWPQLTSAFQHANFSMQKAIGGGKKSSSSSLLLLQQQNQYQQQQQQQQQQPSQSQSHAQGQLQQQQRQHQRQDTSSNPCLTQTNDDLNLPESEAKCMTQPLLPLSKTLQDIILAEFLKSNQLSGHTNSTSTTTSNTTANNNQELLETINSFCPNPQGIESINSLNDIPMNPCIFNSTVSGFCASLPNLTAQFQRPNQKSTNTHNNNPNMNNTTTPTTLPTNKSTPTTQNVTASSFDSNDLSQLDTNMSDVNTSTDIQEESTGELNYSTQMHTGTTTTTNTNNNNNNNINNKLFHLFPYRRHQSLGLISRTRSAPLSLATGYSTNRHYHQLHSFTGVHNSMNSSTSVTSAANILAMEAAAASNFASQQTSNTSNQLITDQDVTELNKNIQSDGEVSSRSKVVLQLRKKILERSEFLTSDRSGVSSLDSTSSLSRTLNQSNGRGNPLLERTASSPVVNMAPTLRPETVPEATFTTVLAYDLGMLAHHCTCQTDANHPENPQRLISIWQRLQQTGLAAQCHHQPGRRASLIELQLVHRDVYTVLFGSNPASRCRIDPTLLATVRLCRLACGGVGVDSDTAWHTAGHTAHAARLAAGCVVDLACRVMLGQCPNGFALVRPPGHHAEPGQAMGFCYFNSIAIATKRVQFLGSTTLSNEQNSVISSLTNTLFDQSAFLPYTIEPTLKPRILIVDWDIHHGNGTQTVFYTDPTVLYISLHRHDEGGFFPGTGSPEEIGAGPGEGFTINIAWPSGIVMSDAEYLAAFRLIVLPVAYEFQPSLVLVSAGFDAAPGHSANLGGYSVSPAAFGWMTRLLSVDRIANSKVVLSLEGGYDLNSLCDCTEACVRALLQSAAEINEKNSVPISVPDLLPLKQTEMDRVPHPAAIQTLLRVAQLHSSYWNCFSKEITTEYASLPASRWLPTVFENSSKPSTTDHTSLESDNISAAMNINRNFFKSLNKANPLGENFNTFTSTNNASIENSRLFNFAMRQASSMDEATDTEMKQNFTRRRSATGLTLSNIDSKQLIDTNETITRIALARLAELHVTQNHE
ncbi:unnamed protein product [Trichobilharzia szidati]|nr:unnamed protein product [Trichobilharzia szidati]